MERFSLLELALVIGLAVAAPAWSQDSPPMLSFEIDAQNAVKLRWDSRAVGFVVEETDTLDLLRTWRNHPGTPALAGWFYEVTLETSEGRRFYRLRQADLPLPPDPATVAPALDKTVASDVESETRFLYEGPAALQLGVVPEAIQSQRVAVVRGRVHAADGNPLSAVELVVEGHPEFGSTRSRADGAYDLALNGGGGWTLAYRKEGYVTAFRLVTVAGRAYEVMPTVVLVRDDAPAVVVPVGPTAAPVWAEARATQDERGTRKAGIFFPQGVSASVFPATGQTQRVDHLSLRLTEFTVGTNGSSAMPLQLPSGVAYTYAINLGTDQARLKVEGQDVIFDRPVYFSVDNFLGFPVGLPVPVGYVDPSRGSWVPSTDGRVIQLLGADTEGRALVDADGDGVAEAEAALVNLGFTGPELSELALAYAPTQSLWRVPLTHFSQIDLNFPYYQEYDSPPTTNPPVSVPNLTPNPGQPTTTSGFGEVVHETQSFRERLPLPGVPFALHYDSRRMATYRHTRIRVPVTPSAVPPGLTGVEVTVTVAGRSLDEHFDPEPDLVYEFEWDGLDAYGREAVGSQKVLVEVTCRYPLYYGKAVPGVSASFGQRSSTPIEPRVRVPVDARVSRITPLVLPARPVVRNLAVAGWSLGVHHAFDPAARTLYLGTGENRSDPSLSGAWVIETVAGNGTSLAQGLAGKATDVAVVSPWSVATLPDNSVYLGATGLQLVSGSGALNPVTGLEFDVSTALAAGPDGSVYLFRGIRGGITRITPGGAQIPVVAPGTFGFAGDDGPALSAAISTVYGMAVAADGTLYFSDSQNHRVRRVGPDGRIQTVAGSGPVVTGGLAPPGAFAGDGGPATTARLNEPRGLALAPDGSLYIADHRNHRIRHISPDGIITTVAGTGGFGPDHDGQPAMATATVYPTSVALNAEGVLHLCAAGRVRRVEPDGRLTTFAGPTPDALTQSGFAGDGGPAVGALLNGPQGMGFAADGSLWVADLNNHRVRRIRPSFFGGAGAEFTIASKDASQVFAFDARGRHLRTLDALTGAPLWAFEYNSQGQLITVVDVDGNRTALERDALGNPTAVVGPSGQRNRLAVDGNGWLASVENPAGETTRLVHTADGLLTRVTGAKGDAHAYAIEYDVLGLVSRVSDPAGGFSTLTRTESGHLATVVRTTAAGRTTESKIHAASGGETVLTVSHGDGSGHEIRTLASGRETIRLTDGTRSVTDPGPDPRFGMHAPVPLAVTETTPSGRQTVSQYERSVTWSDPLRTSLQTVTDRHTRNGLAATSVYDASTRSWIHVSAGGRPIAAWTDAAGRTLRRDIPGLDPIFRVYDARGHLDRETVGTGADARVQQYAYDTNGLLQHVVDPLGRTNAYTYDAAGRRLSHTRPDGAVTQFGYDAHGNMTSFTPPGRPPHRLEYSSVDLPTTYTPPATQGSPTPQRTFYDSDRRIAGMGAEGTAGLTNLYDNTGRLIEQRLGNDIRLYTYHPQGPLASIAAAEVTVSNTFDGALPTRTEWSGALSGRVVRDYDAELRLSSLQLNDREPVFLGREPDGWPIRVGAMVLNWNPTNQLLLGSVLGEVEDAYEYDRRGQATRHVVRYGSTILFEVEYTHDRVGRLQVLRETIAGSTDERFYHYDLAGRLTQVDRNGSPEVRFTYDANGNRLAVEHLASGAASVQARTYNDADQLLQSTAAGTDPILYEYDAAGALAQIRRGSAIARYTYDPSGNLRTAELAGGPRLDYVIDGNNRRVGRRVQGVLVQGFLYAGYPNPVAMLDSSQQVVAEFVYASRFHVPDYMLRDGNSYRFILDHLGSPRLVVDATTGHIVQRIDYDESGQVLRDTNPGFQPFGFAGGLLDPDTGWLRFGARDYDPSTGRWNSRDPLLLAGGSPNLYTYALNDPVNCLDPLGLGPAMQAAQHLAGQQPQVVDAELHPSPFVSIPAAWQEYSDTCNQWLHNQAPGYEVVHDGANFVANCFTAVPGVGHFANYAFTLADHGSTAVFNQLATDYYVGPSVNTQAVEDAYYHPGAFGPK